MTDKERSTKAKSYLSEIASVDALIQRLCNTVATLRFNQTNISIKLSADKVQTSGPKDTIATTTAKIIDLENDINQHIDKLVDLKRDVFHRISMISDYVQQNVLIARYVQMKKWETIAIELDFSVQWVYELHGRALLAFYEINQEFLENREEQS